MRERRFLVEGKKNVLELLSSDIKVELLVISSIFFQEIKSLEKKSIRFEVEEPDLITSLGTFQSNEGALAIAKIPNIAEIDERERHLFALDGIRDPGNFGTILRTLDWFGYRQVLCSEDCADFYQPKVINSSMGSFARVSPHICDVSGYLSQTNRLVISAEMEGLSINDFESNEKAVIVMGGESHGIRPEIQKYVDQRITIPRYGAAESLNVGVATGIIASYFKRF